MYILYILYIIFEAYSLEIVSSASSIHADFKFNSHLWHVGIARVFICLQQLPKLCIHPQHVIAK